MAFVVSVSSSRVARRNAVCMKSESSPVSRKDFLKILGGAAVAGVGVPAVSSARTLFDAIKDTTEDAKGAVKDSLGDAKDAARDAQGSAKDLARDTSSATKDVAGDAADKAKDAAGDAKDAARNVTSDNSSPANRSSVRLGAESPVPNQGEDSIFKKLQDKVGIKENPERVPDQQGSQATTTPGNVEWRKVDPKQPAANDPGSDQLPAPYTPYQKDKVAGTGPEPSSKVPAIANQ